LVSLAVAFRKLCLASATKSHEALLVAGMASYRESSTEDSPRSLNSETILMMCSTLV
jgi:hypothetical protein